jgi:mRNA interferase RelE/StbE
MKWTVEIGRDFLKDLSKLPSKTRKRVEDLAFSVLPEADNPVDLGKIEKLKGFTDFYKVRYGDYRVGLKIDKSKRAIVVLRVLHRRDIYRQFP